MLICWSLNLSIFIGNKNPHLKRKSEANRSSYFIITITASPIIKNPYCKKRTLKKVNYLDDLKKNCTSESNLTDVN